MTVENRSGLFHIRFSRSADLRAALTLSSAERSSKSSMGVNRLLPFLKAITKITSMSSLKGKKLQLMHHAGYTKLWQSVIAIVVMNEGFFVWLVFDNQLTEVLRPASPRFAFAVFAAVCQLPQFAKKHGFQAVLMFNEIPLPGKEDEREKRAR